MNVAFVNPFIKAVQVCFKRMLSVDLELGEPQLMGSIHPPIDISGVIGLSGDAQGAISLGFHESVAKKMVAALLGTTDTSLDDHDLADAIGELANIVAGYAKKDLNGLNVLISLPNVIIGKGHSMADRIGTPAILVPFKSSYGPVYMELSLKS